MLATNNIAFHAVYTGSDYQSEIGYQWDVSGNSGHDSTGLNFEVKVTANLTDSTHYKNHGDYVSSMGGGDDAAHSCIGMPIH